MSLSLVKQRFTVDAQNGEKKREIKALIHRERRGGWSGRVVRGGRQREGGSGREGG